MNQAEEKLQDKPEEKLQDKPEEKLQDKPEEHPEEHPEDKPEDKPEEHPEEKLQDKPDKAPIKISDLHGRSFIMNGTTFPAGTQIIQASFRNSTTTGATNSPPTEPKIYMAVYLIPKSYYQTKDPNEIECLAVIYPFEYPKESQTCIDAAIKKLEDPVWDKVLIQEIPYKMRLMLNKPADDFFAHNYFVRKITNGNDFPTDAYYSMFKADPMFNCVHAQISNAVHTAVFYDEGIFNA